MISLMQSNNAWKHSSTGRLEKTRQRGLCLEAARCGKSDHVVETSLKLSQVWVQDRGSYNSNYPCLGRPTNFNSCRARYSLFVMKVPLNSNQPTNLGRPSRPIIRHRHPAKHIQYHRIMYVLCLYTVATQYFRVDLLDSGERGLCCWSSRRTAVTSLLRIARISSDCFPIGARWAGMISVGTSWSESS